MPRWSMRTRSPTTKNAVPDLAGDTTWQCCVPLSWPAAIHADSELSARRTCVWRLCADFRSQSSIAKSTQWCSYLRSRIIGAHPTTGLGGPNMLYGVPRQEVTATFRRHGLRRTAAAVQRRTNRRSRRNRLHLSTRPCWMKRCASPGQDNSRVRCPHSFNGDSTQPMIKQLR